jgi:hypothetical protein
MLTVGNNQLTLSEFKFEAAAAPTYYQCPSFSDEYENVIRYYFTTFSYQSTNAGVAIDGNCQLAATGALATTFPRRMCKTPTVVPYSSTSFTAGTVRNLSTPGDVNIATLSATPKGVSALTIGMTGAVKYDVISALIRADARLS